MAKNISEKKTLVIVESPTKAKTIEKFLGSSCTIVACKGHIRKIPEDSMSIDFANGYKPVYVIDEKKKSIIAEIKNILQKSSELILATDEDREGESISWHLLEVLKPKIPYRRMVFHEITEKAITQAFNNGRELDMRLVESQEARRVLDRLFGYTLSPVLWSKLGIKTLSSGRVQSPGLRLVVEREKKRMAYKKSEYWSIKGIFSTDENNFSNSPDTDNADTDSIKFNAILESFCSQKIANGKDFDPDTGIFNNEKNVRLLCYEDTQTIIEQLKQETFKISSVDEKTFSQHPAPPFMTSTLQQEGIRKLHLSARETMEAAQSLYEKGFITYMRTDSLTLSDEAIKASREIASSLYGKEYIPDSPRIYISKSKNAQEAHEAIRPAGEKFTAPQNTNLKGKELQLYTLIYKRTIACQMKDAQKKSTTVRLSSPNSCFVANGVRTEFPGYTKIYVEENDSAEENDENIIPKIRENSIVMLHNLEEIKHETKEPPRFTEASLVQELEKLGIGRPSTYATIIDRLKNQKYVIKQSSALVPTFIGFGVIQVLDYFPEYIEYKFTSDMENDLDEIANGKIHENDYLKKFYEGSDGLEQKVEHRKTEILPSVVKTISVPQLSKDYSVKLGKFGAYLQVKDGKSYSIPDSYTPQNITDDMVLELINSKNTEKNDCIGTTADGNSIFYCTGRYGDYWQICDKNDKNKVKNFSVPKDLLNTNVDIKDIEGFFNLPRAVGKDENGNEITCVMGKFGPYIHCNDKNAKLNSSIELLTITEQEALKKLSETQSKNKKNQSSKNKTENEKSSSVIKNFGVYNGESLDIRKGRYGLYLKYGKNNFSLPKEYKTDEKLCSNLSIKDVIPFINK